MLLLKNGGGGGTAALKSKLDILYKLANGTLYDTQTNAQEAASKLAPAGAVAARIGSIGGKTLGWNQLLKNADFQDSSVWQTNLCSFSADASGGKLSFVSGSGAQTIMQNVPITAGHIYIVDAKVQPSTSMTITMYGGENAEYISEITATIAATGGIFRKRFTAVGSASAASFRFGAKGNLTEQDSMIVEHLYLLDMTAMFGSGNEPSSAILPPVPSIAEYAENHPEYTAMTPLHLAVTEVVSRDTNAEVLLTLSIPAAIRALEGYGQSEIGGNGNTLSFTDGTYTEIGRYVGNTWTLLDAPRVTDVSGMLETDMIPCVPNGSINFPQEETALPVPNSVDFLIGRTEETA